MRRINPLDIDGAVFTRKLLLERYNIKKYETLRTWVKRLEIQEPASSQPFSSNDVIALDEFYIATQIERMPPAEYESYLENGISLEKYISKKYCKKSLFEYLYIQIGLNPELTDNTVVQNTLERLEMSSRTTTSQGNNDELNLSQTIGT